MVKRKGLGRVLNVPDHCYAKFLGGCSPELSNEHPLSATLRRERRLCIVVNRKPPKAATWKQTLSREFPIQDLKVPVLCKTHNEVLSSADSAASRLSDALVEVAERSRSLIVRPFDRVEIDGQQFGRWLCKYHCGCMAMTGQTPHPDLVRYAFNESTNTRVYFLFPVVEGPADLPPFGDQSNLPIRFFSTTAGGPQAFHVTFEGLDVVVTTLDPDRVDMREVLSDLPDGAQLLDRVRLLRWPHLQFEIKIDWRKDGDEAWVLDARGIPTPGRR